MLGMTSVDVSSECWNSFVFVTVSVSVSRGQLDVDVDVDYQCEDGTVPNVFDVIISVYTRITRTKPLYFKWCSKLGLATKLRQSGSQWCKKLDNDENRKKQNPKLKPMF